MSYNPNYFVIVQTSINTYKLVHRRTFVSLKYTIKGNNQSAVASFVIESEVGGVATTKSYISARDGEGFMGYIDKELYTEYKESMTEERKLELRASAFETPDHTSEAMSGGETSFVRGAFYNELGEAWILEWPVTRGAFDPAFPKPIPIDSQGNNSLEGYPDISIIAKVAENTLFNGLLTHITTTLGEDKAREFAAVLGRLDYQLIQIIQSQGGDWWNSFDDVRRFSSEYWGGGVYSNEEFSNKMLLYYKQWEAAFEKIKSDISDGDEGALYKLAMFFPAQGLKHLSAEQKLKILQIFAKEGMDGSYRTFLSRPDGYESIFYESEPKQMLALKILESVDDSDSTEVNEFLEGLTGMNNVTEFNVLLNGISVSLYEALYDKIYDGDFWDDTLDFFFGDNDLSHQLFVDGVYDLWKVSKYNPYPINQTAVSSVTVDDAMGQFSWHPEKSPEALDYNFSASWMGDNPNYSFEFVSSDQFTDGRRKIRARKDRELSNWEFSDLESLYRRTIISKESLHLSIASFGTANYLNPRTYWDYDILQPVTVMINSENQDEFISKIPYLPTASGTPPADIESNYEDLNTAIPIFYLKYVTDKMEFERMVNQVGLAVDVVLTATAVGNISKLRHLKRAVDLTKNASRVVKARIFLNVIDISATAVDYITSYVTTDCDGDNGELCRRIRLVSNLISVAAGSVGGAVESTKLSKSIDDLIEYVDANPGLAITSKSINGTSWSTVRTELAGMGLDHLVNGFDTRLTSNNFTNINSWFGNTSTSKSLKGKFTTSFADFETNADTKKALDAIEAGLSSGDDSLLQAWKRMVEIDQGMSRRKDVLQKVASEMSSDPHFDEVIMQNEDTKKAFKSMMFENDPDADISSIVAERNSSEVVDGAKSRLDEVDSQNPGRVSGKPKQLKAGKTFEDNQLKVKKILQTLPDGSDHPDFTRMKAFFSQSYGIDLDEYNIFTGVQLKGVDSARYCIPDAIAIKVTEIGDTTTHELLILDFKLGSGTKITEPQRTVSSFDKLRIRGGNKALRERTASASGALVLDRIDMMSTKDRRDIILENTLNSIITIFDTDANGDLMVIQDFGIQN